MSAVAEGYLHGYTQGEAALLENLRLEYFLWALDVAYEQQQRLTAEPTPELYLRAGDKKMMAARLRRYLAELESIRIR